MSREKISTDNATTAPGQRLRAARRILGVTQRELGHKCGWKWYRVKDIETGKQRLTMDLALVLQVQWGINAAWLLQGKEPMFLPQPLQDRFANREAPSPSRDFYEVLHGLSGRVTIVSAQEIELIYKLLRVLRSEDPALIQAVTAMLAQFERLTKLLNARFGDLILLDRTLRSPPDAGSEALSRYHRSTG